jgi:HPt (histidine-containing phosphotransfer) domain-containing protein
MQPVTKPTTQELLPLLDHRAMSDWSQDLEKEDVLAILARVPAECSKYVAEIEQAVAAGSVAASKRAAHGLKGMAGNLGAVRLAHIARGIELGNDTPDEVSNQVQQLREALTDTLAALRTATSANDPEVHASSPPAPSCGQSARHP